MRNQYRLENGIVYIKDIDNPNLEIGKMDEYRLYMPELENKIIRLNKSTGYLRVCVNGKNEYLHRIFDKDNYTEERYITDHINGDRTDNTDTNRRTVTPEESSCNRGKSRNNKTGYKGVWFRADRNKYVAEIKVNKKKICLGHYNTALEAAKIYNEAAIKYQGEYARLNIIE